MWQMQLFQINQSEDSSKITILSDTTCGQLHQRPITTASLYMKEAAVVASDHHQTLITGLQRYRHLDHFVPVGPRGQQHSVNVVEGRQSLFLHPALNQALGVTLVPDLGRQVQRPVHLHRLAERETFWHAVESPFIDKGSNNLNNEL